MNPANETSEDTQEASHTPTPGQLKTTFRRELLAKLDLLLTISSKRAAAKSKEHQLQQRWMTIFGYLAQVSARIVTDLEYERLRADVDRISNRELDSNDAGQGPSIHRPKSGEGEEETRQDHT